MPTQPQSDLLYAVYLLATIVGVGGFIWQAILLRQSAKAAKISAEAAERAASSGSYSLPLGKRSPRTLTEG